MSHKFYSAIMAVPVLLLAACGSTSPTTSITPFANPTRGTQPTAILLPQPTHSPTALLVQPTPLPTQTPSPTPTRAATATALAPTATLTRAALAASTTPATIPRTPLATATGAQAVSDLSTIPAPKGAVLSSSSSKAYVYQTDLSVDAVAAFYTSMPPTNGWRYGSTDPSSATPKYIALMRDGSSRPGATLTIQSSKTLPGKTELVIRSFP